MNDFYYDSPYVHPKPVKRHRLLSFFLTVLLGGVFLAGVVLTLLPTIQPPAAPTAPTTPTQSVSGTTVYGDYFRLEDGVLTFLPQKYQGGAVLYVPDAINGETVTAIGTDCFAGCEELTTIYLPDSIQTIYPGAFAGCTNLRGMYFPDGVTYIGADAFAGCVSLEAISVPASMQSIATGAFDGCARLHYIFFEGTFDQWNTLYSHYISPFTYAICSDGDYYHGAAF